MIPLFSNDNQESRDKAEKLFIHVFVGYLLDLLGDRKVEIGHVRDGEILTHERNKYDLSVVNGVEFSSSFFIFDGKACLEYVITHELVHFYERNHNDEFKAYMPVAI